MKFGKHDVHKVNDSWVDKFISLIPENIFMVYAWIIYVIHLPFCKDCRTAGKL